MRHPSVCTQPEHISKIIKKNIQTITSVSLNAYVKGGPIWRSLCHLCWEKMSLAICSNRAEAFIKRSRNSTCCNVDHERIKLVLRYNTCMREKFLSLNNLSFLHSQSDHIMASAPTLIIVLSLLSIPCSQLPKIFATELGGRKVDAIWMADHIERATLH